MGRRDGGGGGGSTGAISAVESRYWQHQAALLDPAAHVYTMANNGGPSSVTLTVPASTTWYARNLWWTRANDAGEGTYPSKFHRCVAADEALSLQAGMTVVHNGVPLGNTPFSYLCQPELVIPSDARYVTDPKGLYYTRLARIRGETVGGLSAVTQFDLGFGGRGSTASIPIGCTRGMVMQINCHDSLYVYMTGSVGGQALNLQGELSDNLVFPGSPATTLPVTAEAIPYGKVRHTRGNLLMPFARTVFDTVQIDAGQGEAGSPYVGSITIMQLPSDW